jgi:hypothetical protein
MNDGERVFCRRRHRSAFAQRHVRRLAQVRGYKHSHGHLLAPEVSIVNTLACDGQRVVAGVVAIGRRVRM